MSHDLHPMLLERPSTIRPPFAEPGAESPRHRQAIAGTLARTPLVRLCDALDAAFDASAAPAPVDPVDPSHRASFARRVRSALADAAAHDTLLTPAQREGSSESYRRHLLAADPFGRYAIAALVWAPGQASPVHAHQTWCGYVVLDGTLTETVYEWDEARHCASETRTSPRAGGAVSFARAGRGGIHRLGNASGSPAVSLHVYGVSGERIATHVNDLVRIAATGQRAAPWGLA